MPYRMPTAGRFSICACAAALLCVGCDLLIVTAQGRVKSEIHDHALALSEEEWDEAAAFYAGEQMIWRTAAGSLSGQRAVDAFLTSVRKTPKRDGFYTEIHELKRLDKDRVMANVTLQIHIMDNSMTMDFSNVTFQAQILWVRHGAGSWKIHGISEVSPRVKGRSRRAGV